MSHSVDRAASSPQRTVLLNTLLEAVEDLLDSGEDYAELSVGRICNHADVARSTFYFHFSDKGSLLVAMAEDVRDIYVGAARAWWELPADASYAEVGDALYLIVGTYRAHRALLGAIMDAAAYDHAVGAAFGSMVGDIRDGIERHLRVGRDAGSISASIDPAAGAGWLTAMVERGLHHLVREADDDESDLLAETLLAFVWRGVYAPMRSAA